MRGEFAELVIERSHAPVPEPWIDVREATVHTVTPRSRIYDLAAAAI